MSFINILLPFESYRVDASKFSGVAMVVEPDTKNTATHGLRSDDLREFEDFKFINDFFFLSCLN